MTDIAHHTRKTDKQLFFRTDLKWIEENTAKISVDNVQEKIIVSLPEQFGGEKGDWSPEHLFLASASTCFMNTFLAFAKKLNFQITSFDCEVIGQVEIVDGRYQITHINLFPLITVETEEAKEKSATALEKAQKYCLISNSIHAHIVYHCDIKVKSNHKNHAAQS